MLQQLRQPYLHWGRAQDGRCSIQRRRLQRSEATQRKERHIGDPSPRKIVDEAVVVPVRHVCSSSAR